MKKYDGRTGWERESESKKIETAHFRQRGSQLVIEFIENERQFTVVLDRTAPGEYSGKYSYWNGPKKYEDEASCRVFKKGKEELLFLGRWMENKENFYWWGVLYQLE